MIPITWNMMKVKALEAVWVSCMSARVCVSGSKERCGTCCCGSKVVSLVPVSQVHRTTQRPTVVLMRDTCVNQQNPSTRKSHPNPPFPPKPSVALFTSPTRLANSKAPNSNSLHPSTLYHLVLQAPCYKCTRSDPNPCLFQTTPVRTPVHSAWIHPFPHLILINGSRVRLVVVVVGIQVARILAVADSRAVPRTRQVEAVVVVVRIHLASSVVVAAQRLEVGVPHKLVRALGPIHGAVMVVVLDSAPHALRVHPPWRHPD